MSEYDFVYDEDESDVIEESYRDKELEKFIKYAVAHDENGIVTLTIFNQDDSESIPFDSSEEAYKYMENDMENKDKIINEKEQTVVVKMKDEISEVIIKVTDNQTEIIRLSKENTDLLLKCLKKAF